jgi:hypothetical protein
MSQASEILKRDDVRELVMEKYGAAALTVLAAEATLLRAGSTTTLKQIPYRKPLCSLHWGAAIRLHLRSLTREKSYSI